MARFKIDVTKSPLSGAISVLDFDLGQRAQTDCSVAKSEGKKDGE
jgi:hypothetical protein